MRAFAENIFRNLAAVLFSILFVFVVHFLLFPEDGMWPWPPRFYWIGCIVFSFWLVEMINNIFGRTGDE